MEAFQHQTEPEQKNPSTKTIIARGATTRDPETERATSYRLPDKRAKNLEQQELDLHELFTTDRVKTNSINAYGKFVSLNHNLHKKATKIKQIYSTAISLNQDLSSQYSEDSWT